MKLKKMLCFFLVLCLVIPSVSTLVYDKAEAAEKDAFGFEMTSLGDKEKEEAKENNPYGTKGWFPLSTISELYVARGNNSTRYFNTYDYNGTNMGDTGSIGNVFSGSSVGKSEGNKDGYHFMDTAGCDVYGEGQKKYTVSVGYNIKSHVMDLFLTDAAGNRISNTVTLGNKDTLDYLEEADAYENTGFISVAAGDFDGDGKDSVVVYVPEMESGDDNHKPAIYMYDISETQLTNPKRIGKVYDLLGCGDLSTKRTSNGRVFRNAPVVQLVAEDTDKDNVDELIITAGLNHTYDKADGNKKQSQMFIMDYNATSKTWNESFKLDTKGYDKYKDAKRLRWAASSVGNISKSSESNNVVDYPEIITAGWIDKTDGDGKSLTHSVGSYMTTCTEVKKNSEGTNIGTYSATMLNSIESSEFTKGGHFQDDVQCLLPVAAFLADGIKAKASVLISDTVYALNAEGDLEIVYRDGHFNDDDDGIGGSIIQNGLVQDVVTGNFDGNEEGREQVIFTTCQKRQSFSQYFNKIYTYQKNKNGNWSKQDTGYFFEKKNWVFVSLCALDTDKDSTIVKLEDVERTYTEPEVLAILEATPYFAEIEGGDIGNSQTAYGTSKGEETVTSKSHGLSTQIIAGYEAEVLNTGGGFETTIENNFTWETAQSTSMEYSLEYGNDTEDNMVIVYRRPVTTWKYQVKNRTKSLYLSQQGNLLTSMISVDEYNEIAEQYKDYDLDEITNNIVSEPGNPFSYRSNLAGYKDKVLSKETVDYNAGGTITQSFTYEKGQESSFTYDFSVSFVAYGLAFGVKAGGGAGYNYSNTKTTIDTSSITKLGSVTSKKVDGYNFNWQFAHWTTELNDMSVPVLGYVLTNVVAPPSPPENLSVSEVDQTTATITWDQGQRSADEYRIYQLYDDGSMVQIGVADGTETSYRLTRLRPNSAYTYVLTSYTESGANSGESIPSEEVKVTTLPDGVESIKMVHPKDTSAKKGGSASFSADISVISEDYQATNYQWQKRVKGEAWEDISGATGRTLNVSNVTKEDDETEYRCIFKVSYSSATALVRYYSNAATLTVGKTVVEADLTIAGYDGGSGTQVDPYKGKSDYQIEGTPEIKTTTKEVNVEIPKNGSIPKLTVYQYGDVYYGIGSTATGDAVYYTVTKATADEKDTYTAGSEIKEVTTPVYKGTDGNPVAGIPAFKVDTPVQYSEDSDSPYSLRGVVTGTSKTPASGSSGTDTRLETVTDYTLYWYKDGKYYTYNDNGSVGSEATPNGNADSIFDVYLFTNEKETSTVVTGTDIDPVTGEVIENTTEITTTTETVILGREETWMVASGESGASDAYEEETGYLYTRLIKTTVGEENPTIGVTVMEMSEETSYKDSNDKDVTDFNPAAWSIVTAQEKETTSIPTYEKRSGSALTLTASIIDKESSSAAKGAKVDFQITNTKTNAQVTKSGTANANGVVSTTWTADASGLYKIQVLVRSEEGYAKYVGAPQYYEAEYTYENATTEYRLKLLNDGEDALGSISFGESVSVKLQERDVTVDGTTTTFGDWKDSTTNVAFTYANSSSLSSVIQNNSCQPAKAGAYTFCAYELPEGQTTESITVATFAGKTPLATASLIVNKVSITVTPKLLKDTPESAGDVELVSTPAVPESINLKNIFDISCSYFTMTVTEKAAASGKFTVTTKYKTSGDAVEEFKNNYVVTFESKSFMKQADSAQVNFSSGENGTINGFYSSHYYPIESGTSRTAGTKLRFQAVAKDGYAVDYWMINGEKYGEDASLPDGMTLNDDRDILDIESFDLSKHAVNNALTVKVFYKAVSNPVTFSVKTGSDEKTHGTIEAVNSTGKTFTSGAYIRNGSSVTFTATQDKGYVVDQWLVNNKIYHWSGTDEAYRGTTLTLEDIQSAQNVVVSFKESDKTYTIVAGVADEAGNEAASLATISAVNAETKETILLPANDLKEGTSITFTAAVTNASNNMVKEWQISTDNGATYETAKGSGGSDTFTLYNVSSNTKVRAIVTKAQTYTLNYQVKIGDTAVSDDNIASLTAASNGQTLANGSKVSAYIPVEFNLKLNNNYYVLGWSDDVKDDETDSTRATMESLTSNTSVTVTIAEKPVISWGDVQNGTVTATMPDPSNETDKITVENGTHIMPGTDVTFTFTPNKGYVVDTEAVKANGTPLATAFADGNGKTTDVRTCTISDIQTNQNVEAAFTALNQYKVTYNVVNTIIGQVDGSLSVSAGRKDLNVYAIKDLNTGDNVYAGSDITFTAAPKSGYQVKQWKVNGEVQTNSGLTVTTNTLHVSSVDELVNVTVEFIQSGNKITIQAGENGKIDSALAGGSDQIANIESGFTLGENASVVITAKPDAGYEVEKWTVNNETVLKAEEPITDSTYTYKADGTKSGANIAVYFQQIPYAVSWSGQDGTVTAQDYDGNSANIRGGREVTFTVTPDEGQMIDYWTVNGVKVEGASSKTFTWIVPNGAAQNPAISEYKIQAVCKEAPFTVTYNNQPDNGTLTAEAGSKVIASGDTVEGNTVVTFTAAPNSGYMVGSWSVNGTTVDSQKNTYSVTVTRDTEVSVTLIPDTYTVKAIPDGSGTVAVGEDETGTYKAKYGSSLTFTAIADEYCDIEGWYVNDNKVTEGVSSDKSTFTLNGIKSDQVVKVKFVQALYYSVSYGVEGDESDEHGTLEVKADDQTLSLTEGNYTNIRGGAKLSFEAKPEITEGTKYMVDKWYLNGIPVEDNISNLLSIKKLSANVAVQVAYREYKGYAIPESGNGYIVKVVERIPDDTDPKEEIRENGDLTFTVMLDEGFNTLSKLVVNGYDCIADRLVDENQSVTGCETLESVKNEDGSYTITLKNVTDDIQLNVEAHNLRKVEAKKPTCIEVGNIEYWECQDENCSNSTKIFADENGYKALGEGEEIIPIDKENGHDFQEELAVFTWSENNTEATVKLKCALCQEEHDLTCKVNFKRESGKLIFTASAEYKGRNYVNTVTTAHKLTKVPAKASTCIEQGNIGYWVCNDENCPDGIRKFADENGNKVLADGQELIPVDKVNGHDYSQSDVTFRWSKNGSVKAYVICSRCGEKKEIGCTVTQKEGIGTMTFTATSVFNNQTYTDAKTVKYTNSWARTVVRVQGTASKNSIKLKWNAVPKADGYVIYWNKCRSKKAFTQVKVIKSGKTLTWTNKGLKAGSDNIYYVKAYKIIDGKRYFIKKSSQIHLETKGGKYTNVKKLKSSVSKVTLKKGKTKTLKIIQTYAEKNKKPEAHMRPLTYATSNKKVATVTKKGVIKARGKGSCYIYITAFSGVYTRVKVTVK